MRVRVARCAPCDAQWCVGVSLILLAADGLTPAARSGRGFDAASGAAVSSAQAQAGASSSGVATSQATTTTTTTVRTGASSSSPGNVDSATAAAFAAMHTENESLRKELRRALGVGLSTASREAAAAGLEGDDSGDVALSAELRAIRARCSELEGHVRRQATVIDVRRAPCVCVSVCVYLCVCCADTDTLWCLVCRPWKLSAAACGTTRRGTKPSWTAPRHQRTWPLQRQQVWPRRPQPPFNDE